MKARKHTSKGPVVLTVGPVSRRRDRRDPTENVLGGGALEAPLPGRLLVLLSRLHRTAEPGKAGPDEAA